MDNLKRYHPFVMIVNLFNLVKYSAFFTLFFIFSLGIWTPLFTYGRIAFLLIFTFIIFIIIRSWFVNKYTSMNRSFYIYSGVFIKKEQVIPFSKIQNVQRRTSFVQRLCKLTSLTLETGIAGDDATIKFKAITLGEADRIEDLLKTADTISLPDELDTSLIAETPVIEPSNERVTHFNPTKKDIVKASFVSFSFLFFIPIIISIYTKVKNFDGFEETTESFLAKIISSPIVIAIIMIAFLLVSISIGLVRTYLKYGKYDISSDFERIYITKGVLSESTFTILKEKVQAIEITQSTMKRILGLAEIKLISAGGIGEDELETNSLYPFLPVKRAYEMIHELLPAYDVVKTMHKLPKKSFWIRLLKPSWFWIIVTVAVFYFKPAPLNIEQAWWIISASLLLFIIITRILDYFNTKFILNNNFIQFKTGSLQTSVFISKRDKIIEVAVTRSKFQQLLGLASIKMINRAKPVHHSEVHDLPVQMADDFYTWYIGRIDEIEIK